MIEITKDIYKEAITRHITPDGKEAEPEKEQPEEAGEDE